MPAEHTAICRMGEFMSKAGKTTIEGQGTVFTVINQSTTEYFPERHCQALKSRIDQTLLSRTG
jgi:hypothetical protein